MTFPKFVSWSEPSQREARRGAPGMQARGGLFPVWVALAFSILVLAPPTLVAQSTYHVATDGADRDPGTAARPFATVQHAVNVVQAGDTILVHGGTYRESVEISRSGRDEQPIVLMPAGDGAVVVRSSLTTRSCSETSPAPERTIRILDGADHWTIRGLEIVGGVFIAGSHLGDLRTYVGDRTLPGRGLYDPDGASTTLGLLGSNGADYNRIVENRISGRGIYAAASRYGTIVHNEVYDIDCGTGPGILLGTFSDGWRVAENDVHDIAASEKHWMSEGIRLAGASMYNLVQMNTVARLGGPGRGFTADMMSGWNVIRDNRASQTDQGFSEQYGAWGNSWLHNVSSNNRKFGFNVYIHGAGLDEPDELVPMYLVMRCNQSVNDPTALSIGWTLDSSFGDNDVPSVDLGDAARSSWAIDGNTWNDEPIPPDRHPSSGAFAGCS